MNEFNNYSLDKTYLVAVSTGPDSMALLHKLLVNKFSVIVCFVNYHHRVNSNYEQDLINNFCCENNCQLEVLEVFYKNEYGNFENWAREVRYDFFRKVGQKYGVDKCFVGHHLDDLLETYLLQIKRGYVSFYGLKEEVEIKGVNIIRPLLNYTKQELQDYCKENNIIYSYDYTNEDVSLDRNKIRHKVLSKYSYEDKIGLLKEINDKNSELLLMNKKINSLLGNVLNLNDLKGLSSEEVDRLLYAFINQKVEVDLSKNRLLEIRKVLSSNGNKVIKLNSNYCLIKEYECLNLVKDNVYKYYLVVDTPTIVENEFIKFDLITNPSLFYIKEDSYPIIIRNVEKDKEIKIGKIHKKINRLLIDEKIPYLKRLYWPEIVNNKGEIIFVPRASKDNENLFVVKDLKDVI